MARSYARRSRAMTRIGEQVGLHVVLRRMRPALGHERVKIRCIMCGADAVANVDKWRSGRPCHVCGRGRPAPVTEREAMLRGSGDRHVDVWRGDDTSAVAELCRAEDPFTLAEIAQLLGISRKLAEHTLTVGLRKMRDGMGASR